MAIQAPLRVERTLTSDSKYRLTLQLDNPTGIPEHVFLILTQRDQFVRICVVADFVYPDAPQPESQYHRAAQVSKTFDTLAQSEAAEAAYVAALQSLINSYESGTDAYNNSTTTYVLSAP